MSGIQVKVRDALEARKCKACGYPAVKVTITSDHIGAAAGWDYWRYCANPSCDHHEGEGEAQRVPDWVSEEKWL